MKCQAVEHDAHVMRGAKRYTPLDPCYEPAEVEHQGFMLCRGCFEALGKIVALVRLVLPKQENTRN